MPCDVCHRFPVPTSQFEEVAVSRERFGALYRCRACGTFFEVLDLERSVRFTPADELRRFFPDIFQGKVRVVWAIE
jgi:hypothetical protein